MRGRLSVIAAVIVAACGGDDAVFIDAGNDAPMSADAADVDAAMIDAAAVDGAMADASDVDAAMIDAAMIDAAMIDAAMIDAAMIDAAMIDAAMIDAAMIDAAMIDAAVIDAPMLSIVRTPASLTINENATGSFTVELSHQPATGVTVTIAASPAGIANLSTSSITFSTSSWNSPVTVTVTPVADADNQSETTTLTLSSTATASEAVGITVNDTTIVSQIGWPTYFGVATSYPTSSNYAFKVQTGGTVNWTLDSLGLITNAAGNMAKMAVYTQDGANDRPGNLIVSSVAAAVVAGTNTFTVTPTTLQPNTTYWLVFAVSGAVPVGNGTATTVRRCVRATGSFNDAFPATFGSPSCSTSSAANVFATMHQ